MPNEKMMKYTMIFYYVNLNFVKTVKYSCQMNYLITT